MLRFLFVVTLSLFAMGNPASAQGVPPPLTMEGPGDGFPPPGDIPPYGTNCGVCCMTGGGASCPFCNCDEFSLGCPSAVAMSMSPDLIPISLPDRGAIFLHTYWLRERAESIKGGEDFFGMIDQHLPQMTTLVEKDPELRALLTTLMLENAKSMTGYAFGKGSVEKQQIIDAQSLTVAFADSDARIGEGALAKDLRESVLPRLSETLIDREIDDAMACFLDEACATQ